MNYEVVIRKEAQIDLDEIFVWYEEQKFGLGFEFTEAFEATVNKIAQNPFYASCILKDARSASLKKFPYAIIYRTDEANSQIRIIAIVHHRRNPQWFSQRLGD